jgi:hypothetical protein
MSGEQCNLNLFLFLIFALAIYLILIDLHLPPLRHHPEIKKYPLA